MYSEVLNGPLYNQFLNEKQSLEDKKYKISTNMGSQMKSLFGDKFASKKIILPSVDKKLKIDEDNEHLGIKTDVKKNTRTSKLSNCVNEHYNDTLD